MAHHDSLFFVLSNRCILDNEICKIWETFHSLSNHRRVRISLRTKNLSFSNSFFISFAFISTLHQVNLNEKQIINRMPRKPSQTRNRQVEVSVKRKIKMSHTKTFADLDRHWNVLKLFDENSVAKLRSKTFNQVLLYVFADVSNWRRIW